MVQSRKTIAKDQLEFHEILAQLRSASANSYISLHSWREVAWKIQYQWRMALPFSRPKFLIIIEN